jgi:hypothetical protein
MNTFWKSYTDATDETALYPEANTASDIELAYLVLGLIGEIGEVGEIAIDETRGIHHGDLFAEIGDCFWYVARLSKLTEFWTGQPIVPRPHDCITSTYPASMGAIANSAKKIIRDGCNPSKFIAHVQTAADDLATLYAAESNCEEFWPSFHGNILQPNLDKLRSRLKRNKISGDGDKR